MGKTAVVFTCSHADPQYSNERFDWLGRFIYDLRPDYVVDLGDGADLRSLNTFDSTRPGAVVAQNYERDIDSYIDAQERLRYHFKHAKKRKPFWIGFEGNHEYRIKRALMHDPRLEGDRYGISFSHLQTDYFFNEYHEYENTDPGIADYDGVSYSHFFTSGGGKALSGIHHAYQLVQHRGHSSTCGHSHKRGVFFKDGAHPNGQMGLVAGSYKGGPESWAGQANNSWWSGVVVKREIENGMYEPEFISKETLRKAYA